eukprot:CAMPEP_0181174388 /NCGR_PEP_ID=MMETSP1096-20121128/3509_1 /TAXON_ID=156174 ORGANISM="Chrysochromulina ericina, Strain CCMP281" /NCGR_SAMPLE_ID=MMETSP1096 /ASSEMBLY_ACC=CAM_ASM_000453 /LENGTH=55 /DNA_ID=CAMNT_0023262285 /DNA_START=237 /DNA_END=404 /DNA_ORIENTATION=+
MRHVVNGVVLICVLARAERRRERGIAPSMLPKSMQLTRRVARVKVDRTPRFEVEH